MNKPQIQTFGQLKTAKYQQKSIKDELRENLIKKWENNEQVFPGIFGYDDTVIPQIERAILAGHSINFLGLRGQAKTKIARQLVDLLDEWIPIVAGSEVNDDPFSPLSVYAKQIFAEKGDDMPIEWLHRSKRYAEKLATPDVNIADLIGDIDPIKAANLRLNFSDEEVIHFGMIPRANRSIFVINELPDLQPRIQVSLFNILQEGDVQIRGFQIRFPLDIQFVFTANPEDYTNRGSIITPLKDRIQSQIFTHYPQTIDIGRRITTSQINQTEWQRNHIVIPDIIERLIEQLAVEARNNEFIDEKSGVSARLPISAYESLLAAVERRIRFNGEENGIARIGDLIATIPSIVGKIEMVYEGEQEGAVNVAYHLINQAIRNLAKDYFPGIEQLTKKRNEALRERFSDITSWFEKGNEVVLLTDAPQKVYERKLENVNGLRQAVEEFEPDKKNEQKMFLLMEYFIHALASFSLLDRKRLVNSFKFQDYFNSILP